MRYREKYWFLSNFYPCTIKYNGLTFKCLEAAFQSCKCKNPEDKEKFCNLDGKTAKAKGKRVDIIDNWRDVRLAYMYELLLIKFQDLKLKEMLLNTGDEFLCEDNTWGDSYWGRTVNGVGTNHLGNLQMIIRNKIRNKEV